MMKFKYLKQSVMPVKTGIQSNKFTLFLIITLFSSLFLTGCGFHLHGTTDTPSLRIQKIHLVPNRPYDKVQQDIRQQLIDHHFILQTTDAPTLTIVSERYSKQTLAYGSNGQIRRERIRYTMTFKLDDTQGKSIIPSTDIHADRDRLVNQDQLLGDYNEEEILQQDMRREAVERMTQYFS